MSLEGTELIEKNCRLKVCLQDYLIFKMDVSSNSVDMKLGFQQKFNQWRNYIFLDCKQEQERINLALSQLLNKAFFNIITLVYWTIKTPIIFFFLSYQTQMLFQYVSIQYVSNQICKDHNIINQRISEIMNNQ